MIDVEILSPAVTTREVLSLRSLAPLGLGTGQVESLSSYVFRLAALHRVPSRQLAQYVQRAAATTCGTPSTLPTRLDMPSSDAHAFARCLAQMTRQPEVEFLGLGWLHDRWAPSRPLAAVNRWCACCFATMETPYWPLAWSLAGSTTCPEHRRPLEDKCAHCEKPRGEWPSLRPNSDCCGHCANSLQRQPIEIDPLEARRIARLDMSALTQELLGDMQSPARVRFTRPDTERLLGESIRRTRRGTIAAVANTAGFSETALQHVASGRNTASPDMILRLCVIASVPPGAVFGMRKWTAEGSVVNYVSTSFLPQKYRRPTHDWDSIRAAMSRAMSLLEDTPSVREFALRQGVTPQSLRQMFPAMSKSLETLAKRRQRGELAALT